ncbi:MAG: hypothetical protein JO197_22335 [Acidobacteria bacterium]|nr:hypothetical protein [Acidobacteriota bacterium]MBV9474877.1 hypothetical protein [Acidobacteriota bacterium]
MFERYDDCARRAMYFSVYEASRAGKSALGSEPILLGILREDDVVTRELWKGFRISADALRARYPAVVSDVPASAELPLEDDAKTILAYASHEAEERQDRNVSPHHLVLAILRVPECAAAIVLAEHGVEYEVVSEIVREVRVPAADAQFDPVELRASHHELLAAIARSMVFAPAREELVLAVFDALAASGIRNARFHDAAAFESALAELFAACWPPS